MTQVTCVVCRATFNDAEALKTHYNSDWHIYNLKRSSRKASTELLPITDEEFDRIEQFRTEKREERLSSSSDNNVDEEEVETDDDEDEEIISEALPPTFCLFCPNESVSLEDNFCHMMTSHSFFIPDFNYVIDLQGYFIYLGAKVGDEKVCLKCNNHCKQFQSTHACQTHMVDSGHCVLDTEGDAMLEYSEFYDFSPSYADDDDNTDDNELSAGMSDIAVDDQTAKSRALNRYQKQNISEEEESEMKNRLLIAGMDNQVRSLGLSTLLTVTERVKIHATKMENAKRSDHRLRLSVKANKLQKHFKSQNEGFFT